MSDTLYALVSTRFVPGQLRLSLDLGQSLTVGAVARACEVLEELKQGRFSGLSYAAQERGEVIVMVPNPQLTTQDGRELVTVLARRLKMQANILTTPLGESVVVKRLKGQKADSPRFVLRLSPGISWRVFNAIIGQLLALLRSRSDGPELPASEMVGIQVTNQLTVYAADFNLNLATFEQVLQECAQLLGLTLERQEGKPSGEDLMDLMKAEPFPWPS